MLFINFENVSKDTTISGGLTSFKIMATLGKLKLLSLTNSGYKPTIYRTERDFPNMRKGWFIKMGSGQKSGEPLIRFNWYKPFSGSNLVCSNQGYDYTEVGGINPKLGKTGGGDNQVFPLCRGIV